MVPAFVYSALLHINLILPLFS